MTTLTGTLGAVATTDGGAAGTAVLRPVTAIVTCTAQTFQILPSVHMSVTLASVAEGESGAAIMAVLFVAALDAVATTEGADALRTEIITGLLRMIVTAGRPSIQVR